MFLAQTLAPLFVPILYPYREYRGTKTDWEVQVMPRDYGWEEVGRILLLVPVDKCTNIGGTILFARTDTHG